jgi:hypothetical protein
VNQRSSSIFNSNRTLLRQAVPMIFLVIWTVLALVAIDVLINVVFLYPNDPKFTDPSRMQLYFEYGRSAEGQLSRMTRKSRSETAPITLVGWYEPLEVVEEPSKSNASVVSFYGASHTVRLANALGRASDRFSFRMVGAPGATSNWSYGAYLRDRGGRKSRAVVLAFNSNNFAMISSFSPTIWSVDYPMPYTADRFYLESSRLRVLHPPYTSFDQYVHTFYDPAAWSAALDFFSKNDPFYNSFIVRASVLDHSALWRLFRRAHDQKLLRDLQKSVLDQSGFRPESEDVKLAHRMIHEFAIQARSDAMIPVIFIVNNLGYSDNLFRALRPILEADNVPYLSSHTIVSPNDPTGYLPDSHFTDENDDKLARALVEILDRAK